MRNTGLVSDRVSKLPLLGRLLTSTPLISRALLVEAVRVEVSVVTEGAVVTGDTIEVVEAAPRSGCLAALLGDLTC